MIRKARAFREHRAVIRGWAFRNPSVVVVVVVLSAVVAAARVVVGLGGEGSYNKTKHK